MPAHYEEIEQFHAALRRLITVSDVSTEIKRLADFPRNTYSLPGESSDLPHALLRRSNEARSDDVWVKTEIRIVRDENGWLTLEFLAWWVRDLSRAGELIQMRPMALPPAAYVNQLGVTLKFIIDQFVVSPIGEASIACKMLSARSKSLRVSSRQSASAFVVEAKNSDFSWLRRYCVGIRGGVRRGDYTDYHLASTVGLSRCEVRVKPQRPREQVRLHLSPLSLKIRLTSAERDWRLSMSMIAAPADWIEDISNLRLPPRADDRLQVLMDRNNEGRLSVEERDEMAALVDLSERLSLVRADALLLLGRRPT